MSEIDPDSMTPGQREKAIAWLNEKWKGDHTCPICATNRWIVGESFLGSVIVSGSGGISIGKTYPNIGIICSNCFYTFLVNALLAGVLESPDAKLPETKDQSTVAKTEDGHAS
jgi:hypothetical protein